MVSALKMERRLQALESKYDKFVGDVANEFSRYAASFHALNRKLAPELELKVTKICEAAHLQHEAQMRELKLQTNRTAEETFDRCKTILGVSRSEVSSDSIFDWVGSSVKCIEAILARMDSLVGALDTHMKHANTRDVGSKQALSQLRKKVRNIELGTGCWEGTPIATTEEELRDASGETTVLATIDTDTAEAGTAWTKWRKNRDDMLRDNAVKFLKECWSLRELARSRPDVQRLSVD